MLGIEKKGQKKALLAGTLFHACFELHYITGGQKTYVPLDLVQQAGAPDLAADVRKWVTAQIAKYGHEEAATWDVRELEAQSTMWLDPISVKVGGKTKRIAIPLCSRHDLVVGLVEIAGGARVPMGHPVPSGVFILDHKTAARLDYATCKAYSLDGQFLMNALTYQNSENVAKHGPLRGIIVSVTGKHKNMREDSCFREHTTADPLSVQEFFEEEVKPIAVEGTHRLAAEDANNMKSWPKCHSSCVDRYGLCDFFHICDAVNNEQSIIDTMYRQKPERIFTLDKFLPPPKGHGASAGNSQPSKNPTSLSEKQQRAARLAANKEHVMMLLLEWAAPAIPQQHYLALGVDKLGNPHKPTTVQAVADGLPQSLEAMKGSTFELALRPEFKAEMGYDTDSVSITITDKNFTWKIDNKNKSSFSWKKVATAAVEPWFDAGSTPPATGDDVGV